jgi:hypothetical protein
VEGDGEDHRGSWSLAMGGDWGGRRWAAGAVMEVEEKQRRTLR